MSHQTNKNDSLQQIKQEEQNRTRQRKAGQQATGEVDKRTDGPNRPST